MKNHILKEHFEVLQKYSQYIIKWKSRFKNYVYSMIPIIFEKINKSMHNLWIKDISIQMLGVVCYLWIVTV